MAEPRDGRVVVSLFLSSVLLVAAVGLAAAQAPEQPDSDELAQIIRQLKTIPLTDSPPDHPLARTAHEMRRFLAGEIDEAALARRVKAANPDVQVREALVRSKTRLIQLLGTDEAQFFLGAIYQRDTSEGGAPRGSQVEDRFLEWRSGIPEALKTRLAIEFRGRNIINGETHTVFFADVGSQPTGAGERAFSGDVDVNVMSSNLELARLIAESAEAGVREITGGLSGVDIDVVFTVMGMSGPEVYVAETGRAVAARLIAEGRCGNVRRLDLEAGVVGEAWTGPDALRAIGFEAGLRAAAVPATDGLRLPETGPAAILEMARHLDRDILRTMPFEDFDTLFKIAKFVERADLAASASGNSLDSELVRFCKELLEIKASKDWPRAVELVRGFFQEIPVEVQLGRTRDPKTPATIAANRALLEGFGNRCRDDLVAFGKTSLENEIKDLRGRLRLARDGFEDANVLRDDIVRLMFDMEVENRVLQDPVEGLRKMDTDLLDLTRELHQDHRSFLRANWKDLLPDHLQRQLEFAIKMLEQGGETNRQLAAATLFSTTDDAPSRSAEAIDGVNVMLDILDDTLLGPLRGDSQWQETLLKARDAAISEHSFEVFGRRLLPESAASYLRRAQGQVMRVENHLNALFYDHYLAKRIQRTNQIFRESIRSSRTGTAMMTGLQAIRLQDEMRSYWRALDQGGWEAFAVEFFGRRVPAGGAVEHVVMGNYGLATWDLFATIVPPASLVQMTASLGMELGSDAWDFYWSTMLEEFTDELYDTATWRIERTHRLGRDIEVGSWELVAVTYRSREIRIKDYVETKRRQVEEMQRAAQLRPEAEQVRFPYEYVSDDPLMGWLAADDILRENLAHADNVLLILDEAKKHPSSGWRRNDHIHKVWTARWEQVKLAFLLRAIDQLEKRKRAAEFGPDRFNEALAQLHEVTDELRITDQVDDSLTDAGVPPLVMSYLRWLRDTAPAVAIFESPTDDKAWVEATRVVLDALEVYDTVLTARVDAEADFVAAGRPEEDNGLRILTTPFLLAGNPAADRRGHERWRGLPLEIRTEVHDELAEIKRLLVPGSGLDSAADSFDGRILRDVVYHDVFKRMWRHVQSATAELRGGASNLDFEVWWELWKQAAFGDSESDHLAADELRDRVTGADRLAGLGGRELPLARFRAHDAARDGLVVEFVNHYLSERLAALLADLDDLVEEIETLCTSAQSSAGLARTEVDTLSAVAEGLATTVSLLAPRIEELSQQAAVVTAAHATTQQQTTAMGELAADLDRTAMSTCRKLETLKATGDLGTRRTIQGQMESLVDRLRSGLEQRTQIWQQVEEASLRTVTTHSVFDSTLAELEMTIETDRENDSADEAEATMLLAEQQLHDLQSRVERLDELHAQAGSLLDGAREAIALLGNLDQAEQPLQLVAAQQARLSEVVEQSRDCADQARALVEAAEAAASDARSRIEAARLSLAALENRARSSNAHREELQAKAEAAEYLLSLAASYRDKAEEAADAGALCGAMAADLIRQSARITVPSLEGKSAPEAKAELEALGLRPTLRAGDPAPTSHLRFTVARQIPAPGTRISADVPVTITIFGDLALREIPDVVGMKVTPAQGAVRQAGFVPHVVTGDAAPRSGLHDTVQLQLPAAGQNRAADTEVTLRIYGEAEVAEPDIDRVLAELECTGRPGTEMKWSVDSNGFTCQCPDPAKTWYPELRECATPQELECARLATQFNRQMAVMDKRAADVTMNQARACGWHPQNAGYKDHILDSAGTARDCEVLDTGFWNLMIAERFDDARAVLVRSSHCGYHRDGVKAIEQRADLQCVQLESDILDACGTLDANLAQRRIQAARGQGCTITEDTLRMVQTAADIKRYRRSGASNLMVQQTWTTVLKGLADLAGVELDDGPDPSLRDGRDDAAPDRDDGGSAQGQSLAACEAQFCASHCDPSTELDMMSVSVNEQCNECRRIHAAAIQACEKGESYDTSRRQTTSVYRVSCSRYFNPSSGRVENDFCTLLNPGEAVPPGQQVVHQSRSWRDCYDMVEEANRQAD